MKRTVLVSDFSGAEIDPAKGAVITVSFSDKRRGVVVADATGDDAIVRQIVSSGRMKGKRGTARRDLVADLSPGVRERHSARV